jgi:hypothetical protein
MGWGVADKESPLPARQDRWGAHGDRAFEATSAYS